MATHHNRAYVGQYRDYRYDVTIDEIALHLDQYKFAATATTFERVFAHGRGFRMNDPAIAEVYGVTAEDARLKIEAAVSQWVDTQLKTRR